MSLISKLTTRFLLWLGVVWVIMIALWMSVVLYFFNFYGVSDSLGGDDYKAQDIYEGDWLREIVKGTAVIKGHVKVSDRVEKTLDRRESGLQIVDGRGREVYRRGMNHDWPSHISPGELLREKRLNERSLFIWQSRKQGKSYSWILRRDDEFSLQKLASSTPVTKGKVDLSDSWKDEVKKRRGWIQVLDAQGDEVVNFRRPEALPNHYASGELIERVKNTQDHWQVNVWYESKRKWTWIYGQPGLDIETQLSNRWRITYGWGIPLCVGIALLIAWFFGRRLGTPLLHMVEWIENLAAGIFQEPSTKHGLPKSRGMDGKSLRRPFRLYQDVIKVLETLTTTLKRSEEERDRLERTREEWMTGVSHDIKTPLASVKGYADLLEAKQYQWKEEEVRHYAQIIREKAEHMERLLADFNLTFRLENDALPLVKKDIDVVELVRRSAIDLSNHSLSDEQQIVFQAPEETRLMYPLDGHWFKRAINNLGMNALLHNARDTTITLEVDKLSADKEPSNAHGGIIIRIRDNGRGMDEQTLVHLFERYYRGTDTRYDEGTGLGMAIARRLVEAQGGSLHLQSQVGKGTSITITLPDKS
ncbi:sensor histidine kinase [Marininema halotolerans]|uniref:histidine kinase n=1 Tax=Marininema halotolerans TaxID=1155944 RepID=A0A1I6NSQ1_9BACL|nr:HAMP domain-containing sensor histidine kinase [Marininema halotolerans]SFS30875.1 Signal transduction histidine kinase [Marininema halotolerans]